MSPGLWYTSDKSFTTHRCAHKVAAIQPNRVRQRAPVLPKVQRDLSGERRLPAARGSVDDEGAGVVDVQRHAYRRVVRADNGADVRFDLFEFLCDAACKYREKNDMSRAI